MSDDLLIKQDTPTWLPFEYQQLTLHNNIHVFKIYSGTDVIQISTETAVILSADERTKAEKIHLKERKQSYLMGRIFLRQILAKFMQIDADKIQFHKEFNQKPALHGIQFNLSRSGDYIIVSISALPIGIDIEYIKPNFNFSDIIRLHFNSRERIFAKSLPANFYTIWTRKEALLKATGEGIIDQMNEVDVDQTTAKRNNQLFNLKSYKLQDDYILSIAHINEHYKINFWAVQ